MTNSANALAISNDKIVAKANGKAVKVASKTSTNTCSQVFGKLDPAEFQRRIAQRRRAIQHGKNTTGYDEYLKQVPKDQRRPRSMKHPATPDHTLDIPTKRWQGLVKAWYVEILKMILEGSTLLPLKILSLLSFSLH